MSRPCTGDSGVATPHPIFHQEVNQAMQFSNINKIGLAALVAGGTIFHAGAALADTGCITQPATVTMTENTSSSSISTTHIHVVVKGTVDEQARQFEKAHNVIVAIRQRPNGIKSSKHCKDPVKLGWIKPGQPFTNRRRDRSKFTDSWKQGRKICKFHIVHRGGKTIVVGDKDDCANEDIEIVIHGEKPKPQTKQVIEFRTVAEFRSVYDKWITETNNSSSTSTGSFSMQYTCDTANGFVLIQDEWGNYLCRKCPPQPPVTPQPSAPSVTVDSVQEMDTSDYSVSPPITSQGPIRAHVSAPKGDSLTVTFISRFGSWPNHDSVRNLTSTGTDLVTVTYQAPTEPSTEQIKVVVFDNTTGLSVAGYSNEFPITRPVGTCCLK
jgi:hypothetical protein